MSDTFVLTVDGGERSADARSAIADPPAILEDAALQTVNLTRDQRRAAARARR